jgi:hypothetical protein
MSGVQAFNDMLKTFVQELADVFPDNSGISNFLGSMDDVVALDPKMPMDTFVKTVGPFSKQITARDESVFESMRFPGIDFHQLWHSDISETTKEAIWQYLGMLVVISTTVNAIPPEVLGSIESMATEYAGKLERGEITMDAIMRDAVEQLKGVDLSGIEGMDISALTSGLGMAGIPGLDIAAGLPPGLDIASLLGGGGGEEDVLALLEAARPPAPSPKKKSSKKPKK